MNAPAAATTARLASASHVFAEAVPDRHAVAIAALTNPAFLAEAGWDPTTRVLCPPAWHPLLGRPICRAVGCSTTAADRAAICASCRRRLTEQGLGDGEIEVLSARPRSASTTRVRSSRAAAANSAPAPIKP